MALTNFKCRNTDKLNSAEICMTPDKGPDWENSMMWQVALI